LATSGEIVWLGTGRLADLFTLSRAASIRRLRSSAWMHAAGVWFGFVNQA